MSNHLDVEKDSLSLYEFFFKYYSFFALIFGLFLFFLVNDLVVKISKDNVIIFYFAFVFLWIFCDYFFTYLSNRKSIYLLLQRKESLKESNAHSKLSYLEGHFIASYQTFIKSQGSSSVLTKLIISLIFYDLYFAFFYFAFIDFVDYYKYLIPLVIAFLGPRLGAFFAAKQISKSQELNSFIDEIEIKYDLITIGDLYILTLKKSSTD